MKSTLLNYDGLTWTNLAGECIQNKISADLVLCFGSKQILSAPDLYSKITAQFSSSHIAMCSTSGEIINRNVQDNTLVAVALQFDKTKIESSSVNVLDFKNSYDAAQSLIHGLPRLDLSYILVLSEGTLVNGSELVKGLNHSVDNKILKMEGAQVMMAWK